MTPHPIPSSALDTATAIVGRTGSGKTFAGKGAVEGMLAEGRRVCVIDPTGAWWGLRRSADGTGDGLPVVIFGGDHGDVPIAEASGIALGEIVASGRAPQCVVDVSEFSTGQAVRFLTDFFEALYARNRGALHLVLDEADMMAPQNPLPETRRLQGVVNKIVRRGRIKGFRPMMITQRPQVIDKSVLSQVDTLIAMRLTSPQDRKAILEWVKGHAGDADAQRVVDQLAALKVGEGFVWSPAADVLERVTFPPITTFDSSRAPEADEQEIETAPLSAVDVDGLRAALAVSESPKASAATTNGNRSSPADPRALEEAEQRGFERGLTLGLAHARSVISHCERAATAADAFGASFRAMLERFANRYASDGREFLAREASTGDTLRREIEEYRSGPSAPPIGVETPERAQSVWSPPRARPSPKGREGDGAIPGSARKMLAVLDTNPPVARSWQQVATLANLKARGGHYNAGRKWLIETGTAVESGGLVRIAKPSADAGAPVSDPAALVEQWCASLSGAAPRILRALFDHAKTIRTKSAVAECLALKPVGGHWNAAWKELRDNEIVTVTGDHVELTELFKPSSTTRKAHG